MTVLIRRPRLTAAVAAALVVVLVLTASALGLRLPGLGFLDVFDDRTALDYQSRYFDQFAPLSQSYLDQQLGPAGVAEIFGAARTRSNSGESSEPRRVSIDHSATNDSFANAFVVPSVPFSATTTSRNATREPAEPGSCSPTGGTVWYRFTPRYDATLFANTFGTSFATALAVFSGSTLRELRQVACNVHGGDTTSAHSTSAGVGSPGVVLSKRSGGARVTFPAQRGTTYYVQVASPAGGGRLMFSLELLYRTTRLVDSTSDSADVIRDRPAISADGRHVAFVSRAVENLEPNLWECPVACYHAQVLTYDRTRRTVELVSATPAGEPGSGSSVAASISGNGRFVAFISSAADLVDPVRSQCESCPQVYVRDLVKRTTEIVSLSDTGQAADLGVSQFVSISADGRSVAFDSWSGNLTREEPSHCREVGAYGFGAYHNNLITLRDGNCLQVYAHDRASRKTELVSVSPAGSAGEGLSDTPSLSADGRFVAFESQAANLVSGDANRAHDVFIRDRRLHRTEPASVSSSGRQGSSDSYAPKDGSSQFISADGRFIAFPTSAALARDDTNETFDVYVRDRLERTTTRASISSSGEQASSTTDSASISSDGRYVAFASGSASLVGGDDNLEVDAFVHDMRSRTTVLVSKSSTGEVGNDHSNQPRISPDGRVVVFFSFASNLTNDTPRPCASNVGSTRANCPDLYIHDGRRSI